MGANKGTPDQRPLVQPMCTFLHHVLGVDIKQQDVLGTAFTATQYNTPWSCSRRCSTGKIQSPSPRGPGPDVAIPLNRACPAIVGGISEHLEVLPDDPDTAHVANDPEVPPVAIDAGLSGHPQVGELVGALFEVEQYIGASLDRPSE